MRVENITTGNAYDRGFALGLVTGIAFAILAIGFLAWLIR